MEFTIYTDGGCSGNKRGDNCPGGYGYLILDSGENILLRGGGNRTNVTNNQMELLGVIAGLKALKKLLDEEYGGSKNHVCIVRPDSKYVSDNFDEYMPIWKKNGWRKTNGKAVINLALWKVLDSLTPEFLTFRFNWVKGHHKNKFNNIVDEIATSQVKKAKTSLLSKP